MVDKSSNSRRSVSLEVPGNQEASSSEDDSIIANEDSEDSENSADSEDIRKK